MYAPAATQCVNLSFSVYRRSEEHTSELQSRLHLVCRLLLEKKKHAFSAVGPHRSGGRAGGLPSGGLVVASTVAGPAGCALPRRPPPPAADATLAARVSLLCD